MFTCLGSIAQFKLKGGTCKFFPHFCKTHFQYLHSSSTLKLMELQNMLLHEINFKMAHFTKWKNNYFLVVLGKLKPVLMRLISCLIWIVWSCRCLHEKNRCFVQRQLTANLRPHFQYPLPPPPLAIHPSTFSLTRVEIKIFIWGIEIRTGCKLMH